MMLSHAEAQALVSARFDGPLDTVAERELNAHLATCPSCRAFNQSAGQLARSLRGLPYLPASPAVSRAVLEHVNAPRSPWSRLALPTASSMMPALSAVAVALIVVFVGTFAVLRMIENDNRDPETLTAPTSQTSSNVALSDPTATATGEAVVAASTSEPVEPTSTAPATEARGVSAPEVPTVLPTDEPPTFDEPATEQPTPNPPTEAAATTGPTVGTGSGTTPTESPSTDPTTEVDSGTNQVDIASGPTARATATTVPTEMPTETPEPTATTVPTEIPTETPEPTATTVPTETPAPTATAVPTEEPTVTTVPTEIPTETPEPTATTVPTQEPTATAVPTETPAPTATAVPTGVPTEVPTETPEPTATTVPTEVPTETPEPTATAIPTEVPTATPVPTQDPDAAIPDEGTSPPIEARDGTVIPADEPDAAPSETPPPSDDPASSDDGDNIVQTVIPSTGQETATSVDEGSNDESGDGDVSPPIEPSGNDTPVSGDDDGDNSGPGSDGGDDDGNGGDDGDGSSDGGDDDDGNGDGDSNGDGVGGVTVEATGDGGSGGEVSLSDAGVYAAVASIPGDPGTRLGISANGELIFSVNPGRVSLEANGLTLSGEPVATGQSVVVCDANGSCVDATSASATGPHQDTPLGWLNGELIYERIDESAASPLSYRAARFDPGTSTIVDDRLLGEGGRDIESILRPYAVDGGLLVLGRGAWLFIDANGVTVRDGNPYGDGVQLIRIHPATGELSYVAGGELITASLSSPGTPSSRIPFSGTDYDLSPDGSQVVITTGSELQIVGRDGHLISSFSNPDGIPIGSVVWLNEGIVFVDRNTGELRLIPNGG